MILTTIRIRVREICRAGVLMTETIIDFIRHGEPQGGSRFRGYTIDDPLTEKGWAQMLAAVRGERGWTQIATSPLIRCRSFAESLGQKLGIPVEVDSRFKEVGFGSWEGFTREELKASHLREYRAFYQDPVKNRPQGAEPLEEFFARVAEAYQVLLREHAGQHVLVVTHAGVVRAVLAHVLDADPRAAYRIVVENAAITRFKHGGQGSVLVFHNRAHL